ncbi:hypothetical protein O7599_17130 [Streptomyces sp. WMMC500]|uniref:GntT/GntP/DsdX family permease n=1 Tax=Streptomyces sp. WMMC500 TaxID=3015154 RepID=UPI00248C91B1|nr:hypothetical protein [Streptomyces sp. WMMC500]WBB64131.1 hypothetical protein O7599_17130 [Streptomyces sp. WMMC500]
MWRADRTPRRWTRHHRKASTTCGCSSGKGRHQGGGVAYVVATALRVAQGPATVALTTAAGLIQPVVMDADCNAVQLAAIVLATAAGSVTASHVNDSGFWLVGRFFNMDVKTTLKTWTVRETTIGLSAFGLASLLFVIA